MQYRKTSLMLFALKKVKMSIMIPKAICHCIFFYFKSALCVSVWCYHPLAMAWAWQYSIKWHIFLHFCGWSFCEWQTFLIWLILLIEIAEVVALWSELNDSHFDGSGKFGNESYSLFNLESHFVTALHFSQK